MTIKFNNIFNNLLTEFKLSNDLSFSIELPPEIKKILDDEISISELGISLKSYNTLYLTSEKWQNKSIIEDEENHFHVDFFTKTNENKEAFMLGIKTLILLAEKFKQKNIKNVRFWYSFQTPELGKIFSKNNNLHKKGDKYYISDRLSFYKIRKNENVISLDGNQNLYNAILIIDI